MINQIDEHDPDRTVSIIGLGYVGLTLAVIMAEAGFRVRGVEINPAFTDRIRQGRAHFFEPGLDERLRIQVESGALGIFDHPPHDPAVSVHIVTVGTPLGSDGRVRLDMVTRVTREIAERLKDGDAVILRSTVKIGTTRGVIDPILHATGKRYDLAFCPERTLEGKALYELAHLPQIIGGFNTRAAVRFSRLFNAITPTVIRVRDPETAEMVKLVDNTSRDVSFAFANEVARLCGNAGVSAAEVIKFGSLGYARTNLPLPGPVGGPCLSKDGHILVESMEQFGIVPEIASASRLINERLMDEVADYLAGRIRDAGLANRAPKVTICGLAFKGRPETNDLRGSTVVPLIAGLKERLPGARWHGYDPIVSQAEQEGLGLAPLPTIEEAFADSHLVVFHNNHPALGTLPLSKLSQTMARPAILYDFWNGYDREMLSMAPGTEYVALGSHPVTRPALVPA